MTITPATTSASAITSTTSTRSRATTGTQLMRPLSVPLNGRTRPVRTHVGFPAYDRSALSPAVVHLGVGGFHRAHQSVYFDELANRGVSDWGVVGVGIRRPEMREVLLAQDNLFTVVQRGHGDSRARVVGVMVEYLLLADESASVLARLTDPRVKLVTLTITGNGYAPGAAASGSRRSVFGLIVRALERRRRAGTAPFTVLSCDNLPDSGAAARRAVMALARQREAGLADWIEQRVTFPSSMVDRITPATAVADRQQIEQEFLIADRWPVITEPFTQWVIQDEFCNDRPPLEQVGVQYVADVAPYKLIKSRMLNGAHSALGYLGRLSGYERTDEAMADPVIAAFITRLLAAEIAPLLPSGVAGMDLDRYRSILVERFGNPGVGDQLARLCRRGSTKLPDYLLPSLHEARAAGSPHRLLLLAVAAWLCYLQGTDVAGGPGEVEDGRAAELGALILRGGDDPRPVLALTDIFGDLGQDDACVAEIRSLLSELRTRGVRNTVRSVLEAADQP